MKTKYQSGFKEQALRKVFARSSEQTVESIAIDLNMNVGTLRTCACDMNGLTLSME